MPELSDLIAESGLPGDTPITDLHTAHTSAPVTWHVTKPLTAAGVHTLGQLAKHTDADLITYTGFGPGRLDKLKAAITGATRTPDPNGDPA